MLKELLNNPFVLGLLPGLALSLYIWLSGLWKQRKLRKEKELLQKHLQTKMELEAESSEMIKSRTEELRKENENLRITVQTLRSKPSRKELELLHIYDTALQSMFERAPGFASAWQTARREAEQEVEQTHKGLLPMIKKAFGTSPLALNAPDDDADDTDDADGDDAPKK